MGVPVTSYTDTDAIRAAIGVTDNEISDGMLADQQLDLELTVDLDAWATAHATIYSTGSASSATAEEKLKANYLTLYAQWFCAAHTVAYMKLAIPQMISDGKAQMRRFQDLDLSDIERRAVGRAAHFKALLSSAIGTTAATPSSPMSAGKPTYDPVVGP